MRNKPTRGWRDWYQLARWRRRAGHQLRVEPWCAYCLRHGVLRPAEIADHVRPHGGDPNRFWLGELQSLCRDCHDGTKRFEEAHGFWPDIDVTGYPSDPRHPFYASNREPS